MGYFHVVFTLPAEIGVIAFQNKKAVYDLLFLGSTETMTRIAADPKHLGARIGLTTVLHTWGSAMTHHPHIHLIVPGGGLLNGSRWVSSRPAFLLPVRVLGALFRRLFLEGLVALHRAGKLAHLADAIDAGLAVRSRQEPIVPGAVEAAGQDVEEEAANELARLQRQGAVAGGGALR